MVYMTIMVYVTINVIYDYKSLVVISTRLFAVEMVQFSTGLK